MDFPDTSRGWLLTGDDIKGIHTFERRPDGVLKTSD